MYKHTADATSRTIILLGCQLGPVRMGGANITGRLSFRDSQLTGADGPALVADGLTVTGGMACGGFQANGAIRLPGAHIGGRLSFSGAVLAGGGGRALTADALTEVFPATLRDHFVLE
jgi:hypothetical protein